MKELILPTIWSKEDYQKYKKYLYSIKDEDYLKFNSKIVQTNYEMIGIRVPILRNIAKKIKTTNIKEFLEISSPKTFEEIFINGIVISYEKDYKAFIKYFKDYLKYIDNWAICDMVISSCKIIKKNKEHFETIIKDLLNSKNEYDVRVGVVILMDYYIEKEKLQDLFDYLDDIKHEGYYVHMAIAWMVSILYIKFPKETEIYLQNNKLKKETHNKAIQKIRESTRISKDEKKYILRYKL